MKVIFLDVDGCLNTLRRFNYIDKDKVDRVVAIIHATGAKVVVSSSRRYFGIGPGTIFYSDILSGGGEELLSYMIGMTELPIIWEPSERWKEIKNWLDKNPTETFCIIEDVCEMERFEPFTIRCDPAIGLTDDGVQKAINILGKI